MKQQSKNQPKTTQPTVFFDARYMRTDYHDGISRYSAELGSALAKLMPLTFLICDDAQKKWLPASATFLKIHAPTSAKEPFTALILNKHRPDVVYSPMQTIGSLGKRYKLILTIHDLIYYRHRTPPKFLPQIVRGGWYVYHLSYAPQRLILKGADAITSVSNTSADDIRKAHMTKKDVTVVYNAPQKFESYPPQRAEIMKNIVYMGSFMPYKNVETLIRGMQWLPGRTLHLLSRISDERKQELLAFKPKDAEIIFHNGVSDDEYEQILANNALLVTASLDEGYGIPVAEAMSMGVPAVISDMPIFREVGGEGALYFNPHSPQQFAETVLQLDNTALRDEHIKEGLQHMQQFKWDESAKVLAATIKSLL